MVSCLAGSGTIGKRILLMRQSTLYARSNTGIMTCQISTTGRSIATTKSLLPRIYRQVQLQQRVFMSTIPSSSPFENIGSIDSNTTTKPLSPHEQLLTSFESLRPNKQIISEKAFGKLELVLHNSYTVPQLRKYLTHHNSNILKRAKKAELIQHIMETDWKLTTPERKRTKELLEKKNTSQQQFKLEKDELYFVLDDNGSMLKAVEETHPGVRIMINMTGLVGTVEGPKRQLASALSAIRDSLVLERQSFILENNARSTTYLSMVPQRVMDDLSKSCGAFISVENDKMSLTAPTTESLNNAKRKLNVFLTNFGLTSKPSLQSSDHTVIQKQPPSTFTDAPLTFLPLHDSPTMPLAMKTIGWSRISTNERMDREEEEALPSQFHLLRGGGSTSSSSILSPLDLKDILKQPLGINASTSKNIGIEATFGHLLFQNPTNVPGQTNLLVPELRDSFDVNSLQNLFSTSTSHRHFFSGNPPKNIRPSLVPVASQDEFHRRTITVDYIASSLLGQLESGVIAPPTIDSPLRRIQLEFIEQDDGELEFKRAIGEHGRSTMDILGLAGSVDVRFTAKEYTVFDKDCNESSLLNLAAQCRLSSYSETTCPSTWKSSSNDMILLDVAFNNESRYQLGNNLVTLRYIEEQDSRTRRAEMKVEPYNSYHGVANGFDSWDDLWCKIVDLAQQWHYRGD